MKTFFSDSSKRHRQNGSTVLVLITLLAIMVILATANSKALFHLHREIKLLENRQVLRLNTSQTDTISAVKSPVEQKFK